MDGSDDFDDEDDDDGDDASGRGVSGRHLSSCLDEGSGELFSLECVVSVFLLNIGIFCSVS